MSASDLYQALIVDHAKAPRNPTLPEPSDATARGNNPMCGDRVDVGVRVIAGVIAEVGAAARACALCVASGSIMTEMARGMDAAGVRALAARFAADLAPDASDDGGETLGDLVAFRGVRRFPSRAGCARLPWDTLLGALDRLARTEDPAP